MLPLDVGAASCLTLQVISNPSLASTSGLASLEDVGTCGALKQITASLIYILQGYVLECKQFLLHAAQHKSRIARSYGILNFFT